MRAAGLGLATFDKLEFDALAAWVEQEARAQLDSRGPTSIRARLEFSCALCGYGIVSEAPPTHCPMCHAIATWREHDWARHVAAPHQAVG